MTAQQQHFSRHPWFALSLIWLAATAFNISKAAHMDDAVYLEIARWINTSPLHPLSGQVNWVNTAEPIYRVSASPLLFIYGLAAVVKCFGESLVALHCLMAVFTGLCIWSFYNIASLLEIQHKVALTAMLVCGPAFIPSQNLMLDIPLMAWSLLCFWSLFAASKATSSRKAGLFVLAGLCAGAGALTKYPGLVLIPLLAFYLIMTRQFRYSWAVLIPVAMIGVWCAFNVFDFGATHLFLTNSGDAHFSGLPIPRLPQRFQDELIGLGATSPFSLLALVYLMQSRQRLWLLAPFSTSLLVFVNTFVFRGEDLVPAFLRVLFLFSVLTLSLALGHALWRPNSEENAGSPNIDSPSQRAMLRLVLLAWIITSTCFVLLFVPFMAVRHTLTIVPPILLLLGIFVLPHLSNRVISWATVACVSMGFWMGASDWQTANTSRVQAAQIRALLPSSARVYFVGHWGWQWYAAHNGMQQYDLKTTQLSTGDYLIAPHIIGAVPIAARYGPFLKPIRDVEAPPAFALFCRTISTQPPTNFYGGGWNPLPWSFSSGPMETYTIFQVSSTPVQTSS